MSAGSNTEGFGLVQNVFGEWVEPVERDRRRSGVGRVIVVTEEMRRYDAETRAAREQLADPARVSGWTIKDQLSVENLKGAKKVAVQRIRRRCDGCREELNLGTKGNLCLGCIRADGLKRREERVVAWPGTRRRKPLKLKPCKWCAVEFGVAAMELHRPRCAKNPRVMARAAVKASKVVNGVPVKKLHGLTKLGPCEWCWKLFGRTALRRHRAMCVKKPESPKKVAQPVRLCVVKGCESVIRRDNASGYCTKHHYLWKLVKRAATRPRCAHAGCERRLRKGSAARPDGLCTWHGSQVDMPAHRRAYIARHQHGCEGCGKPVVIPVGRKGEKALCVACKRAWSVVLSTASGAELEANKAWAAMPAADKLALLQRVAG